MKSYFFWISSAKLLIPTGYFLRFTTATPSYPMTRLNGNIRVAIMMKLGFQKIEKTPGAYAE